MARTGRPVTSFDLAVGFLSGGSGDAALRETFGTLEVVAGPDRVPLTEVEDTVAQTVRRHIFIPMAPLAEWLLANWWRLRWEGRPDQPSTEWRSAHSLAALGGGYAWPVITISSDGEYVQVQATAETRPDVATIRYLREVSLDVPAADFETAIDRFIDTLEARLAARAPRERTIAELREELREERASRTESALCRWQALAGIHPGEANPSQLQAVRQLAQDFGAGSEDELFAALPGLSGLDKACDVLKALRSSATTIDLRSFGPLDVDPGSPWQRGARMADTVRAQHGLGLGPITNAKLGELLSVSIPLAGEVVPQAARLGGGYRNGVAGGRATVLVTSRRNESQRFHLARILGCALALPESRQLLPVTSSGTALQKLERSFAQQLLCPWETLDDFTNEQGIDDSGIEAAAEHFQVSEWLVLSALVNRGKLPRHRLPPR
jgi:hypothetical protein